MRPPCPSTRRRAIARPKSGATFLPRDAVVDLLKVLEDACLILPRDARTGVPHRNNEVPSIAFGADHHHLAGIGELDRVANEVEQHLGEAPFIAVTAWKIAATNVFSHGDPLACASDPVEATTVDDPLQRVVLERQGELAGFDLGKIEHVVDQAQEMLAVLLDALQDLLGLVREHAVEAVDEQLGKAQHGVQGRTQLVAHVGEKLRLVLVGDGKLLPFCSTSWNSRALCIASTD